MFTKIFYVVQEQFPETDTANEPGLNTFYLYIGLSLLFCY